MRKFCLIGIICFLTFPSILPIQAKENKESDVLKQYLIPYIISQDRVKKLPPPHPLYALSKVPLIATTSFVAFSDEPAILKELYPNIRSDVFKLFNSGKSDRSGLITGAVCPEEGAKLSAVLNSLANLEIYSLSRIASSIGNYDDALSLLLWSKQFSVLASNAFFEPDFGYVFSMGNEGEPIQKYYLENLLLLLLDSSIGDSQRERVCTNFKIKLLDISNPEEAKKLRLISDVSIEVPILKLIEGIPEFKFTVKPAVEKKLLKAPESDNPWITFWNESSAAELLFPRSRCLDICYNLSRLLEQHSLMADGKKAPFMDKLDELIDALTEDEITKEEFIKTMAIANKLLIDLSNLSNILNNPSETWRGFNESRLNRISPRTRRIIKEAFIEAIEEVKSYKGALSELYASKAGIRTYIELPKTRTTIGEKVPFKAMIKTVSDTLSLFYAYLQIGDRRWKLTKGKPIILTPKGPPIVFSGKLTLPPSAKPGILSLPVLFDLNSKGSRLELYRMESIYLSRPSRVSINFPDGRSLRKDTPLTIELIVKYPVKHDVRGKVEGVFLKEIATEPPLPAGFILKAGQPITSLPISIVAREPIPAGRYPFSLIVSVGSERIAFLSDEITKPLRWLHLGPLSKEDLENRSPISFQNELLKTHRIQSGRLLRWKEVPWKALDIDGRFRPDIVYSAYRDKCFLLYTVIDLPYEKDARWQLDTESDFTLWINSQKVAPKKDEEQLKKGSLKLRKGINSILVSACCNDSPGEIGLVLGDENMLPLFGMNNDIDKLIDGFEKIVQEEPDYSVRNERMEKVTFSLNYPEARSVSVIGTFNNWDPDANPMKKDIDGTWKATLYLIPGRYSYKFIINKKTKITDPISKQVEPDGFGGLNSVIIVR